MRATNIFAILLLLPAIAIAGQTVLPWTSPVKLHHVIGQEKGTLSITGEGIAFRSLKGRTVSWDYFQVQTFSLSPQTLAVETYQNRNLHLPGVQRFRFDLDQVVSARIAAELARKTIGQAMSSGVAQRPRGHRPFTQLSNAGSATRTLFKSVSTYPGAMALTRMPCCAHSTASALVSCPTAPLEAV